MTEGRVALTVLFALGIACTRQAPTPEKRAATARPAPAPSAPAPPRAASSTARAEPEPEARVVQEVPSDAGLPGLRLGELADVGPAAPATAFADGVALVAKDDRLVVARLAKLPSSKAALEPIGEAQDAFAPLARGPSVAGGAAYWVSQGRLVRRGVAPGAALEILATDARNSTRTSAVELDGKAAVAYLGRPDDEGTSRARLWFEAGRSLDLTPEGAGASSVALARHGAGLLAVSIDGRSAMTPVHARKLGWRDGRPELEPDVVTWVAGPAQAWTEIVLGSSRGRAFAHMPIERDVTHFGLATVDLGGDPTMDSSISFFDYPNGIDLAPAAAAELCGRSYLSFARPVGKAPRSPQELVLAEAGGNRFTVVANGRGFASVSLSPAPGGGLVAYVADGRTWARGLACE
ncbi:MAG TPA: hypothetical protein VGK73_29275 [Polyangiaceae bacterium]